MKIDYTNYMSGKPHLNNPAKEQQITAVIHAGLDARGVQGAIEIICYEDSALVRVDGEFYGMWSYAKGRFFAGVVGDYR